jgi:hypothetical protein
MRSIYGRHWRGLGVRSSMLNSRSASFGWIACLSSDMLFLEKRVAVDPEKVKAVVEWIRPTSVFEIRSFLGLASYYRRFIEGFSKLSGPLIALTRKNACFVWMDECEQCFQELKRRLVTTLVLALPTESGNFVVYSDASKKGLGCVLM